VSDLEIEQQSMTFTVDEPGKPVLVKTSYFPNWNADGAEGPFRVAPNLMVVVPTQTDVSLTYGRSWVEWFALAVSLVGVGLVIALLWRGAPPWGRRAWQFAHDSEPGDVGPIAYYSESWRRFRGRRAAAPVEALDHAPDRSPGEDPDATLEPSPDWMVAAQEPAETGRSEADDGAG
jgi:hypothetical protein